LFNTKSQPNKQLTQEQTDFLNNGLIKAIKAINYIFSNRFQDALKALKDPVAVAREADKRK